MRFIACLLEHAETWRTSRQTNRISATDDVDLLLAFREADQLQTFQTELAGRDCGGAELSCATIDDDEVRLRLLLIEPSPTGPPHYFVHGREVVSPDDRFHFELPILGAARASVVEPHAGPDGVGSLSGRDVEADE